MRQGDQDHQGDRAAVRTSITIPTAVGETSGGGSGSLSPPSADFRPPTNGFRVDEDLSVGDPTPTDTYWAQAGLRAPPEGGFETTRAFEAWAASAGVSAGVDLGADVEPVPINQTAPNQTVPIGNLTEYSDTDDSDDNAEQPHQSTAPTGGSPARAAVAAVRDAFDAALDDTTLDDTTLDDDQPPPHDTTLDAVHTTEITDNSPALTADIAREMTATAMKEALDKRGLSKSGLKKDLLERLLVHIVANPDFGVADELGDWKLLTPIEQHAGQERKWGFAEQFPRPKTTAPDRGTVRMQHLHSEACGVGDNHRPSKTLRIFDHPVHFINLFYPESWKRANLLTPTNAAAKLDWDETLEKNKVYPEFKEFNMEDIDFKHGATILNGLSPKPQELDHMRNSEDGRGWMYGVDRLRDHAQIPVGWRNPARRMRHWARYFRCADPLAPVGPDPLQKVRPMDDRTKQICLKLGASNDLSVTLSLVYL
jgi:hypothetical protein